MKGKGAPPVRRERERALGFKLLSIGPGENLKWDLGLKVMNV